MGRTREQQREYMRRYRERLRQAKPDTTHAACDARIAELEAEIRRLQHPEAPVDDLESLL